MKVLFDTNIYFSDAIFGGVATRAIAATVDARWKIFVCESILREVYLVIGTKFGRSRPFAHLTTRAISDIAEFVDEPLSHHRVVGDPDDTPILRAAVAASVDYLITGDAKFLALGPVEGVQIITLAEYVVVLEGYGLAGA